MLLCWGILGVIPGGSVDITYVIHSLGVCRSRVGPFLAELAVASLHKSCGILCTFPLQSGSPPGVVSGVLLAQPAAPSLSVLPVQPARPRHEVPADLPSALPAHIRLDRSAHAQPKYMPSTTADEPATASSTSARQPMRRRHAILLAASTRPTKRRRVSGSQPEPPVLHALQGPLSGARGHATTSPAQQTVRVRTATQPHGASHMHLSHSSGPSTTQQPSLIATPAALAPSALSTLRHARHPTRFVYDPGG